MQAVLGIVTAVSAFGVAYASHLVFPVKPIEEGDILLSQSTLGTINVLTRESIQKEAKTPREMIDLYLARKANLEDILELVTGKSSIKDAYDELKRREKTAEHLFLIKAAEQNYGVKSAEPTDENQQESGLLNTMKGWLPSFAAPQTAVEQSVQ